MPAFICGRCKTRYDSTLDAVSCLWSHGPFIRPGAGTFDDGDTHKRANVTSMALAEYLRLTMGGSHA
ncbi:MAG TPA: hypothetical protein VJA25_02040 [Dehalococcoidia bacterium]|nr:hypothetical protein [Dehalococcoidia bacterium]